MPRITDKSTIEAIAREFCKDRCKSKALQAGGYSKYYSERAGLKLFTNVQLIDEIARLDAESAEKAELTIQSVLKNIDWGIKQAVIDKDLPALARLSELQGKYLSMWSEQGNNAATGLSLNFTTRPSAGPIIVKLRKGA